MDFLNNIPWIDVELFWLSDIQAGGESVKLWLKVESALIVQGASIQTGEEIYEKGIVKVRLGNVMK